MIKNKKGFSPIVVGIIIFIVIIIVSIVIFMISSNNSDVNDSSNNIDSIANKNSAKKINMPRKKIA